jgi:3D (Asp-Asp-Asp) domain-containing protein
MVESLMDAKAKHLPRSKRQPLRLITLAVPVVVLLLVGGITGVRSNPAESRAFGNVLPIDERVELTYDGPAELLQPVERVPPSSSPGLRQLEMEVTAYCACPRCCGPNARGITASGKHVSHNNGRFVAADTRLLPFGTKLSIPGYHGGVEVEVIDRGGAIKGNKLDVYFPTHEQARQWGRRKLLVTVFP